MTVRKPLCSSGSVLYLSVSDSSFRSKRRERNGKKSSEKMRYSCTAQNLNRKQTGMRCGRELMGNWMRIFWYTSEFVCGSGCYYQKGPQSRSSLVPMMERYGCQSTESNHLEKSLIRKGHPTFLKSYGAVVRMMLWSIQCDR